MAIVSGSGRVTFKPLSSHLVVHANEVTLVVCLGQEIPA